jgi:hypothetical protein
MAHPNIEERRKYIKQLLAQGVEINYKKMVALGEKYNCSPSAIRADLYALKRKKLLPTPHVSHSMRNHIRKRDGYICQYCGTQDENREYIVEHVIPASKNGVALPFNLVMACQNCNTTKRNKVWIPRNIDLITKNNPDWKTRILNLADPDQFGVG